MRFRAVAHPTAPDTVLVRWYGAGLRPGTWVALGSLVMTAAEWRALRSNFGSEIAVHQGTPLFGGYYRRAA